MRLNLTPNASEEAGGRPNERETVTPTTAPEFYVIFSGTSNRLRRSPRAACRRAFVCRFTARRSGWAEPFHRRQGRTRAHGRRGYHRRRRSSSTALPDARITASPPRRGTPRLTAPREAAGRAGEARRGTRRDLEARFPIRHADAAALLRRPSIPLNGFRTGTRYDRLRPR